MPSKTTSDVAGTSRSTVWHLTSWTGVRASPPARASSSMSGGTFWVAVYEAAGTVPTAMATSSGMPRSRHFSQWADRSWGVPALAPHLSGDLTSPR